MENPSLPWELVSVIVRSPSAKNVPFISEFS